MAVTREAVSFTYKQVMPKYGDWDQEWVMCLTHDTRIRGSMGCTLQAKVSRRRISRNAVSSGLDIGAGSDTYCRECTLRGLSPFEEGGVVGSRCVAPIASFEGASESSMVGRSISAGD